MQGMRAPFLATGGEEQFTMLQEQGFEYDCSMPSRAYGVDNLDTGIWPFTLDYDGFSTMDCQIGPCPKCSYPGIWVQPMLELEDGWLGSGGDPDHGSPCSMVDACM